MIPVTFLNPWILLSLLALPLFYYILRLIPPPPRKMIFPATRFLLGLTSDPKQTKSVPWWMLVLRLCLLACLMIAFARPILNPQSEAISSRKPLMLVIDNGWASAQTWSTQKAEGLRLLNQAKSDNRIVILATTARSSYVETPLISQSISPQQAIQTLQGLQPQSWPADRDDFEKELKALQTEDREIVFLSHGLDENILPILQSTKSAVTLYKPTSQNNPVLLRRAEDDKQLSFIVDTNHAHTAPMPVALEAYDANGKLIDRIETTLAAGSDSEKVIFELPGNEEQHIHTMRLNRAGAGAVYVFEQNRGNHLVGIVVSDTKSTPLQNAEHYLTQALANTATIVSGALEDILEGESGTPGMIILPDIATLSPAQLDRLEKWIDDGGLLVRFGGPNMTRGDVPLVPVPLRPGSRAMDGSLSQQPSLKIKSFSAQGPLADIPVTGDVTITQQILAEPAADLAEKTWATLDDGTPFITASAKGDGLIVLIHTTATPEWSDFALSGSFISILDRIVSLAGAPQKALMEKASHLQPLQILDGQGRLIQAPATIQTIAQDRFASLIPSADHPPGLYGTQASKHALNLGDRLPSLSPFSAQSEVTQKSYGVSAQRDLAPLFLALAFILFLIDGIATLALQHLRKFSFGCVLAMMILCTTPAHAQAPDDATYAGQVHLAYIATGSPGIDATTRRGLEELSQTLEKRTSIKPGPVTALNPATDKLMLFPFIYWAITPDQPLPTTEAIEKLQTYIDGGGFLLVDTRDGLRALSTMSANRTHAANIMRNLNFPPLVAMTDDHALTKSFYLLKAIPDWDSSIIWIEDEAQAGLDGYSNVVLTGMDLAYRIADPSRSQTGEDFEYNMRIGVNFVLYSLTGNYKSDQIHIHSILQRLGQ